METEAQQILDYLKGRPGRFLSVKEISAFVPSPLLESKGPLWAAPYLKSLVHKEMIEANEMNHYRFVPAPAKKKTISVSPRIAAILKASGKNFSETVNLEDTNETLESYLKKRPTQ